MRKKDYASGQPYRQSREATAWGIGAAAWVRGSNPLLVHRRQLAICQCRMHGVTVCKHIKHHKGNYCSQTYCLLLESVTAHDAAAWSLLLCTCFFGCKLTRY